MATQEGYHCKVAEGFGRANWNYRPESRCNRQTSWSNPCASKQQESFRQKFHVPKICKACKSQICSCGYSTTTQKGTRNRAACYGYIDILACWIRALKVCRVIFVNVVNWVLEANKDGMPPLYVQIARALKARWNLCIQWKVTWIPSFRSGQCGSSFHITL